MKLEILYRPKAEFKTRNDIAIHVLEPNYRELLSAIEDATNQFFPRIVVYSDKQTFWTVSNIKNSQSTWNKLIRDVNGDVHAGEVGYKHGRSDGDGFTIYFEEGSSK